MQTVQPSGDEPATDLGTDRAVIDRIDADIVRLLAERRRITDDIGRRKRSSGVPIQSPDREAGVIDNVRSVAAAAGLAPDDAEAIYRLALALSRASQYATS